MSPPKPAPNNPSSSGERLQKVLAAAGVGSRRDCEELIVEGRVEVDGETVTTLGTKVDPDNQIIRVDGEAIREHRRVYYALNKPAGVVTTNFDPSGRMRVIDLVPDKERVFAIGRLDRASEGLIIVTNDGELSFRLTHPKFGVEKEYLVRIAGKLEEPELLKLRKGIHLSDGFARVVSIRIIGSHKQSTDLEIVLREGKNREIRRILAGVGHKVLTLKRVAIGPLRLGEMPPGASRKLSPTEVKSLLTQRGTEAGKVKREKEKRSETRKEERELKSGGVKGEPAKVVRKPTEPKMPQSKGPAGKGAMGGKPPAQRYQPPPSALDDEDELLDLDDFLPPGEIGSAGKRRGSILEYGDEPLPPGTMPPERIKGPKPPRQMGLGRGAKGPQGEGKKGDGAKGKKGSDSTGSRPATGTRKGSGKGRSSGTPIKSKGRALSSSNQPSGTSKKKKSRPPGSSRKGLGSQATAKKGRRR